MDKKKEKEIFDKVYSFGEYYTVSESEKPDFIIEERDTGIKYGVEITEHYFSDTSATIRNSKDFAKRIFEQKEVKSQEHRKHIEFSTFSFITEDGKEETFEGIMTKKGEVNLHNLKKIIDEKNSKFNFYNKNLFSTDLIIYDRENFIDPSSIKIFTNYLINDMRNVIIDSPFKSIFLITQQETGEVYLDLKIQTAYFLVRCIFFILEKEHQNYNITPENHVQNMCWLLKSIGLENISYDSKKLLFNGFIFDFTDDKWYIIPNSNIIDGPPEYTDVVFDDVISNKLKDALPYIEIDRLTLKSCDEKIVAI